MHADKMAVPSLRNVSGKDSLVNVEFTDGKRGSLPFLWLRDNCRCEDCYDFVAVARKYAPFDIDINIQPTKVSMKDARLNINWTDDHQSIYDNEWLYQKGLSARAKMAYRSCFELEKEVISEMHEPVFFNYNEVLEREEARNDWLNALERKGVAIIKNAPVEEGTGPKFLNQITFSKLMQFGISCSVKVEDNYPYVSHTDQKLCLHTDVCYYEKPPGIVLIHFLKQAEHGGESLLVDGFSVAQYIRREHPAEFEALSSTNIYFYDKANLKFDNKSNRHKIHKSPIISLDSEGNISKIVFNNVKRDAPIDLPQEKLSKFYKAMKLFNKLIYEHAKVIKMQSGYIVTLDNYRMLHGREAYKGNTKRHLEISYLDWDEAKSLRRCLQDQTKKTNIN